MNSPIISDLYITDPPPDVDLPPVKRRVSKAGDARYHLLAWSSPAWIDSEYALAVLEKYLRSKAEKSRCKQYIIAKLETLERQLPQSAILDDAFATVRRRYSLPASLFRCKPPTPESLPRYATEDPLPHMTMTLLQAFPENEIRNMAPTYSP